MYVTLPVPLKFIGISLGVGAFTAYVGTSIKLAETDVYFWRQVTTATKNFFLLHFNLFDISHMKILIIHSNH